MAKSCVHDSVISVRRRLDEWRRTRRKRGPVPANLWKEAARLAELHGINPVARALRLDYYALKSRLESGRPSGGGAKAAFVEVAVAPPVPSPGCIVEVERPDGARMRLQLSRAEDLVAVTGSFWRWQA